MEFDGNMAFRVYLSHSGIWLSSIIFAIQAVVYIIHSLLYIPNRTLFCHKKIYRSIIPISHRKPSPYPAALPTTDCLVLAVRRVCIWPPPVAATPDMGTVDTIGAAP